MAASKHSPRGGTSISVLQYLHIGWARGTQSYHYGLSPLTVQVECVVETRDREHAQSLKQALEKEYGDRFIMWGERKPSSTSLMWWTNHQTPNLLHIVFHTVILPEYFMYCNIIQIKSTTHTYIETDACMSCVAMVTGKVMRLNRYHDRSSNHRRCAGNVRLTRIAIWCHTWGPEPEIITLSPSFRLRHWL